MQKQGWLATSPRGLETVMRLSLWSPATIFAVAGFPLATGRLCPSLAANKPQDL